MRRRNKVQKHEVSQIYLEKAVEKFVKIKNRGFPSFI